MKNTFDDAKKNKNAKKCLAIKFKEYVIPLYLIPLAIIVIPYYEIEKLMYKRVKWSEKKATKVLNAILPKLLTWNEEDNHYYRCIRKFGPLCYYKVIPMRHRKFVRKFDYALKDYLINKYENEFYTKTVEEEYEWYTIVFVEKIK